ncbi:MAG TPA: glycoside hydrolase family 127 protein [Rectinemataceae bacterium]|nr:glycoside hydrolase family 127 protein [Rectinemataceae bacterium]
MAKFSPYAIVGEIPVGDMVWTKGFWADRVECCHSSMIPAMWSILVNDSLSHAFANFRIAAGMEEGEHSGPPFFDGDLYKWLESVASVFALTKDPELDSLMDRVIGVIAKAQRADGYLHTPVIIAERNKARKASADGAAAPAPAYAGSDAAAPAVKAMVDRLHFEVYNFGHLMTTACRHFEATGKRAMLDVAVRAADYLIDRFANPDPQTAKNNICPAHYMGLIELFRITGKSRFRDFAAALIDNRNLIQDGTDDNQDRIPFRDQRKAVGHSVRANYLYAGVADVYAETGDETLLPPLFSIWDNVAHAKTYITGATGALYDGVSPDGDEDHWSIQRVHQAYGREYQLPNTTAYNETCANIGNALWNWRMFRITGEVRFLDVIETVLFNSVLSGISLDGRKYFYQNTLREESVMPVKLRWPRHRSAYLTSFCCPPNVLRTIAGAGTMAYGITDKGVTVNLYGGNRLATKLKDGSPIRLSQKTNYPWDGDIAISVEEAPAGEFSISLRIPNWAPGATISVNGQPVEAPCAAGAFREIRRSWAAGDLIRLTLPMAARMLCAHPLVEESRNQAAVMRGPIVYCVESADLPEGLSIKDIMLRSDAVFSEEPGTGALKGLTLLGCAGARLPSGSEDSLYRELPSRAPEDLPLKLVPYFAWDNRGEGEMTVWLPLRWA